MKISIFLAASVTFIVCGLTVLSHAELINNHDGTVTDSDTRLMWLQDANYAQTSGYDDDGLMNWDEAKKWAKNLEYAGYDDWRLPSALNTDGSGPCLLNNCTDSEMGHLYYQELGNPANGPLNNSLNYTGHFQNVQPGMYWTGTEYENRPDYAWHFHFPNGFQSCPGKSMNLYALAVRSADAPRTSKSAAPLPAFEIEERKDTAGMKQHNEIAGADQTVSQEVFTIQTGSFMNVKQAQQQFESLTQTLNGNDLDYLRIEKVGKFYTDRLGKFKKYSDAVKFHQAINHQVKDSVILKAYIKNKRIIKMYSVED